MKSLALVLLFASAASAASLAADPRAGTTHVWKRAHTSSDWRTANDYDALVFLPADYGVTPTKKYPVIISLHGLDGTTLNLAHTAPAANPEGFIRQVKNGAALQATFPAIVIAPDVHKVNQTGKIWWQHAFTLRLVQDALAAYAIDPKRVVVTGLSAGGAATEELAALSKPLLAGAMPVAYMPPHKTIPATPICHYQDLPMWASGNKPDGTFNAWEWSGAGATSFKTRLEACAGYTGKFKLTVNETGGHTGWDAFWAQPAVRTWLVSQLRP